MEYKFTIVNLSDIDGKEFSESGWKMKDAKVVGEKLIIIWEKDNKKEALGQLNSFIDDYINMEMKKNDIDPDDEDTKKMIDDYIGPVKLLLSSMAGSGD